MRFALPLLLALLVSTPALSAEASAYTLVLKNHRYQPNVLHIPANTRVKIDVINQDPTPEEFESDHFPVEKIVLPNSRISVNVGPLKPGRYGFYGDFHQPTAQGTLVVD
ncbi:MAG: cupredoxin domain-containing protein [Rhodanobacter sp.]